MTDVAVETDDAGEADGTIGDQSASALHTGIFARRVMTPGARSDGSRPERSAIVALDDRVPSPAVGDGS